MKNMMSIVARAAEVATRRMHEFLNPYSSCCYPRTVIPENVGLWGVGRMTKAARGITSRPYVRCMFVGEVDDCNLYGNCIPKMLVIQLNLDHE